MEHCLFSVCNFYLGEQLARGMLEGFAFAWADPYRAVTHNKGSLVPDVTIYSKLTFY